MTNQYQACLEAEIEALRAENQRLEASLREAVLMPEWVRKSRDAGVSYNLVRDLVDDYNQENISVGRLIESLREIAFGAAKKMAGGND